MLCSRKEGDVLVGWAGVKEDEGEDEEERFEGLIIVGYFLDGNKVGRCGVAFWGAKATSGVILPALSRRAGGLAATRDARAEVPRPCALSGSTRRVRSSAQCQSSPVHYSTLQYSTAILALSLRTWICSSED